MNDRKPSLLLTDLYELTMSAAFLAGDFNPTASFELFVRRLPQDRGYLIAAGLQQALEWLHHARFSSEDIDFLTRHPVFRDIAPGFFDYLSDLRFTGEIWAMPEGTAVFAEEPILRVTAPLIEAQIVETYLLAVITFQTMIASKAMRVVQAAEEKSVIEMGSRRAHGPEAGILAARAAYIAGCAGTSNVEAGLRFGIPTFGTIAHSYVMALDDEAEAFESYTRLFPQNSTLLIDTYDTLAAVDKIVEKKLRPTGVRIDSGDLAQLSRQVREKLDAAGRQSTKILLSGDLDEFKIEELKSQAARVDSYGVGTALAVSNDAPALGGIYKLVELQQGSRKSYHAKFSQAKMTHPGTKQVYRFSDANGRFTRDLIACSGERVEGGDALLKPVMKDGAPVSESESLAIIRNRVRDHWERLPEPTKRFRAPKAFPVEFSAELQRLLTQVRRERKN
ncbi:MAG TPA: nicotinate phosphoribosyltransferase [Terriglobales bacterium]|nr:nicotinate phosphoribosyltransferase [Terriglobales bacterium]